MYYEESAYGFHLEPRHQHFEGICIAAIMSYMSIQLAFSASLNGLSLVQWLVTTTQLT